MNSGDADLIVISEVEKIRDSIKTIEAIPVDLAKQLVKCLKEHPSFKGEASSLFFGDKQLMLLVEWQTGNLLSVAKERGSQAAIEWMNKVFSTKTASIKYVAEVHGLAIKGEQKLKNGVTLLPLDGLPYSKNAQGLLAQYKTFQFPAIRSPARPILAILEVENISGAHERPTTNYFSALERTIKAFTLAEQAAPVIGVTWTEFSDPDLSIADIPLWMSAKFEGALNWTPQFEINSEALSWVNRYIDLKSDVKSICDIAIDRLNLARRRYSPGNKAIEGAICLESLLGDDSPNDLTYKLKLRTALLLETELEKRRELKKAVGEFYNLRSKAVHGRAMKDDPSLNACASQGLEICKRVLQAVVERNERPQPSDWELMGRAS